jgi:hypothetical protein
MKVSIEEKLQLDGIYFIDEDGDIFVRDFDCYGKFICIASNHNRIGIAFDIDDLGCLRPFVGKLTIDTTGDV